MPFDKNTKFFSSPVIYQGRGVYINGGKTYKPIAIDVRHFIQANDFFLEKIVKSEGIWDLTDNDAIALACLRFVRKHVKYTPDKEQMGVDEFWTFPNETLALGKGDCFAGYEEIYTEDGLKRIDQIKVGDMVLSYDFSLKTYVYKPVTAAWAKGELQINRVHVRNGQWMDVSENHPMWSRCMQKESKYGKEYLSDIDLTKYWSRKIPIAKKIPYKIEDIGWLTPELCVVLGHFLAEGWVRKRVNIPNETWTSGEEATTHIVPILEKYNIAYKTRLNGSNVTCLRFLDEDFSNFLYRQYTNTFNIHLEEEIFHLPSEKLEKILYGYWLGDGTKNLGKGDKRGFQSNRETIYSTSSKKFAEDIQRIGLQLGRSFHIWKQEKHGGVGKKPIYRITYNPASHFLKDFGYTDISEVSIKKIEKLESTKMYDITVADTHTVVMKNGIITHQCDDGAILFVALARNAGISAANLRVCAGWVDAGKNAPLGGHAYAIYKASDGEWRVFDWCIVDNSRTKVNTPQGLKRFKTLKKGDDVIGFDEKTGKIEKTKIVKIGKRMADVVTVKYKHPNSDYVYYIQCTPEHPWSVAGQWKQTKDLKVGEHIDYVSGRSLCNLFQRKEQYLETSKRQTENNVFCRADVRQKLSKNNGMKNPDIVEKVYSKRLKKGYISKPEAKFIEFCESFNLPIKFVGDGSFWINGKNPDFKIDGKKKVIEVTNYGYLGRDEKWAQDRIAFFKKHGFEAMVVFFTKHCKEMLTSQDDIIAFILNGAEIVSIENYKEKREVYNIHCEPHNNYFVNGLLSHNCYYPNDLSALRRLPYYQEPKYKDIWFSFNDKGSWSKNRIPTTVFKSCRSTSMEL